MTTRNRIDQAAAGVMLAMNMSVPQVAKHFGVTPEAVYNARAKGKLAYRAEDVLRVSEMLGLEEKHDTLHVDTAATIDESNGADPSHPLNEDRQDAITAELWEAAQRMPPWTRENCIAVVKDFAKEYGRPPTFAEWSPNMARRQGHPELAERFEFDACWPQANSIVGPKKAFATWNQLIAAAGFAARTGKPPRG